MSPNDWSPPHSHDPNPTPPGEDPTLRLYTGSMVVHLTPDDLARFQQTIIAESFIVSTGHGTSGPFTFEGVQLEEIIYCYTKTEWKFVDIISGDDFRTRITHAALHDMGNQPAILALRINGRPMKREEGLVRLIVPNETVDALKQVKWIREIRIY